MSLREAIKKIARKHPKHPLDALWLWAKRGKNLHSRWRRFGALGHWANRRAEFYRNHKQWDKAHQFAQAADVYFNHKHRLKKEWLDKHKDPNPPSGAGTTIFDGKPVANWIAAGMGRARQNGWGGVCYSGFRSPEYSESLCINMCGRPSCPGTCAGKASNHSCPPTYKCQPYEGAADCTDAVTLRVVCARIGVPLHNHLPYDVPHSSYSGY